MLKNYFKTAWRSLSHNKTYSLLNILGLSAGMAIALIIGLWVHYQYSYDRFLPDYENAYKVDLKFSNNGDENVFDITPLPLGLAIKNDIPGVKYMAQTWTGPHSLMNGGKKVYMGGAFAGADFLHIFKFPLLKGNASEVMKDPNSIVLTETTAKALFGKTNPLGKFIRVDNMDELKVTGVLKDIPVNSTLQFSYLIPFDYFIRTEPNIKRAVTDWGHVTFKTYVSLEANVTYEQIRPRLKTIFARYNPQEYKINKGETLLQPIKEWHLFSDYRSGSFSAGFIQYVRMFSIIGLMVLLIACINFTNMATARSEKRAREVGVRKVIGSSRKDLIFQFLTESLVITCCAGFLAIFITKLALTPFNRIAMVDISIPMDSVSFWGIMAGYIIFTGLLAGSRPAFYLSSFRPVQVLKGAVKAGKRTATPRKILVVVQFSCSIALIIGTAIIYQQIQHAKNREIGYSKDRLLMTDFNKRQNSDYAALKHDLLQSGAVSAVTKSSSPITEIWSEGDVFNWPGKTSGQTVHTANIGITDGDYFKTMGMQFIIEDDAYTGNPAIDARKVVLNEAAVKAMKLRSPINQTISLWENQPWKIAGVVKDAVMTSPFATAVPTLFILDPNWSNVVTYKLSTNYSTAIALQKIEAVFNKYSPAVPFTYKFADEAYQKKFELEILIGRLAGIFALFAIMISCLGLFGLIAYLAEQRSKEIGIRKVLGASVGQVWLLLTKDFVILVVISALIASPIAYFFLQDWLQKYAYRITISPLIFIGAGIGASIITILTISIQSIKAALINPAKVLKSS